MPDRVAKLPRDVRGYPIPYTVMIDAEGKPHFPVVDDVKRKDCMRRRLCGVCGELLGYWIWFVGGDRSAASRLFTDPPMHEECARYSLAVCAFLARPASKYRRPSEPKQIEGADGERLVVAMDDDGQTKRPPHMALYRTRQYVIVRLPSRKVLELAYHAAPSKSIEWFPPLEAPDAGTQPPTETESEPLGASHEAHPAAVASAE
jgi:hypothetical protein